MKDMRLGAVAPFCPLVPTRDWPRSGRYLQNWRLITTTQKHVGIDAMATEHSIVHLIVDNSTVVDVCHNGFVVCVFVFTQ